MFGQIELICGPMFSGKTNMLLVRAKNEYENGMSVLMVKYKNDNRYTKDNYIISHSGIKQESVINDNTENYIKIIIAEQIEEILPVKEDIVCIDEGQFYSKISETCDLLANLGKKVIVAALDADYKRNVFLDIGNLVPKCEKITKLEGICYKCKSKSHFTKRISDSDKLIEIGSAESYMPMCRRCYFNN
jgi:thymidine kinase